MVIGIDYDETWSAKPDLWRAFGTLCNTHNVVLIIVTNRGKEAPITEDVKYPVVYAAGKPKRQAAKAAGYTVSIWIDDYPHLVDLGHSHPVALALGLP